MSNVIPANTAVPAPADLAFVPAAREEPNLREWVGVLLRRGALALAVAAAVFAAVMLVVAQKTPTYTATGSLVIEPRRENLARLEQMQAGPTDMSAIDTQVEVLRSPALAAAVVRKLQLFRDPEFNPKARSLTGEPDARTFNEVTERVMARTYVRRAGLTQVVYVSFVSESPEKASRVTNAILDTYLERQLEQKLAAVTRANRELGQSVEVLRREAEEAEAKVQEYRIAHNLYSAEGATMAEQEVSTLNQQIAAARADYAEKQARLSTALAQLRRGGGGHDVGAALGSQTVGELRAREAEVSRKLAQLQADFKPEYPEVRRTQAELNDIRGQLQVEVNRILSSLRAEADAAGQRQASLLASRGAAQGGLVSNNRAQVGLLALQQRADAAKQIYEGYLNRAQEIAVEGSLQQPDARVNSTAATPTRPSSPNMTLALALAALLAMIAAAVAVVVAELWNRTVRSRADVERHFGLVMAGVVPDAASMLPRRAQPSAAADYLVTHRFSAFAEAFRSVRAFLSLSPGGAFKTIAVTSSLPREGKTITALCMARTLAMSGSKVVLVDCDLRRHGTTTLTGGTQLGLIEVLADGKPLDEVLRQDPKSSAFVLPAGGGGGIPFDVFTSPECEALFEELERRFDYVVIDTPPVIGVADARVLAARADRVLYVVQWNKTPVRTAQAGLDILAESGANVAGVLLTKVDVRKQARNGYQDSSDYFSQYTEYFLPKPNAA